jgi:hypothetical protein
MQMQADVTMMPHAAAKIMIEILSIKKALDITHVAFRNRRPIVFTSLNPFTEFMMSNIII